MKGFTSNDDGDGDGGDDVDGGDVDALVAVL